MTRETASMKRLLAADRSKLAGILTADWARGGCFVQLCPKILTCVWWTRGQCVHVLTRIKMLNP